MIYIIDNGESYSDHAIYFVETNAPEDKVRAFLLLAREPHEPDEIIGVTAPGGMRKEGQTISLSTYVSLRFDDRKNGEGGNRDKRVRAALAQLKVLLAFDLKSGGDG